MWSVVVTLPDLLLEATPGASVQGELLLTGKPDRKACQHVFEVFAAVFTDFVVQTACLVQREVCWCASHASKMPM